MKILVCGDKHLKITRFEKSKLFLEWFSSKITEIKPDLVVALGDDFDTHAVLRSEIMSEFRKHVDHTLNLNIPMVYIVGNHDYFKPGDTTYHALQGMKGIDKDFHVVDKHTELYGMDFVPYIGDHNAFPNTKNEICFAHQTFVGADYGYHRPDIGVDAAKVDSKIIIAGHMHKRQTFGKVYYPGTPYAHNLNDVDQDKGIMLFDTDTYAIEYISSPFPKWRSVKFDVEGDANVDCLHELLKIALNDKDNWVLQISGPKAELTAYLKTKKYINLVKGKSVSLKLTLTDNLKKNAIIKSISMVSIVDEYVQKIYSGSIDKDKLYDKALSIIEDKC